MISLILRRNRLAHGPSVLHLTATACKALVNSSGSWCWWKPIPQQDRTKQKHHPTALEQTPTLGGNAYKPFIGCVTEGKTFLNLCNIFKTFQDAHIGFQYPAIQNGEMELLTCLDSPSVKLHGGFPWWRSG